MAFVYFLYYWLVALPVFIVFSIIIAVLVGIASFTIGPNVGGYPIAAFWGWTSCLLFLQRVKVVGKENVKSKTSYIITPNHQSALDIILIYGAVGTPFSWVMKQELRKIPFIGWACMMAGHIYIDRSNLQSIKNSIVEAKSRLNSGSSVVIFPEGSRSNNGELSRFKKGAFQVAVDLQLPIIPTILDGAHRAMPKGTYYIKPQELTLRFLPAISTVGLTAHDVPELKDRVQLAIEQELNKLKNLEKASR